jgi:hypothetical protein
MWQLLLGESRRESQCRFLAGLGILTLSCSCAGFAIHRMDVLAAGQILSEEPSSDRDTSGKRVVSHQGHPGFAGSKNQADEGSSKAVIRERANLISAALLAAIAAMISSWALIRYIITSLSHPDRDGRHA